MKKMQGKQFWITGLFLVLVAGMVVGSFAAAADRSVLLQGITRMDPTVPGSPDSLVRCVDRCQVICGSDHWYSGICKKICPPHCIWVPV